MADLTDIIHQNRNGGPAIPSVCSAHPDVLTASLLLAQALDRPVLIEATSNQVNHRGGYTGMTPADFIADVRARAAAGPSASCAGSPLQPSEQSRCILVNPACT